MTEVEQRFAVGDRVEILAQDNPIMETELRGVFGDEGLDALGPILVADAPAGSRGTVEETHHYPAIGVRVDGAAKGWLTGYFPEELRKLDKREEQQ